MGKLHELLAVESDLKTSAARATKAVSDLFGNAAQRFVGQVRRYRPLTEEGTRLPDERQALSATVKEELDRFASEYGRWIDAAFQKEQTNMNTSADIVIDDTVVISGLCTPALLNLESRLSEIRRVFAGIPINDAAETWNFDEQQGCYVSETRKTLRTKKVPRAFEAAAATKEHPAQVHVFQEDVPVGEWETTIFSGAISPTEKRTYLDKIDALIRAVKAAKQRANAVEASREKIANILFGYINGG
jgi:hypothetical protein